MHPITMSPSLKTKMLFTALVALLSCIVINGSASALSGSDFNAGNIIDDSVFNDDSTMSASQIQAFLNAKVPVCDTNGTKSYGGTTRAAYGASRGYPAPYTCLKDYEQTIPTIANGGSDLCKNSISGGTKTAARIIYDVAKSCDINPQVLIVLLQKEQSLITDDWPWSIQYRSATGYGCPDTAPCDSEYYGFFNQVYQAAKAFRRYEANPANYNYRAGRNNTIYYHPDLGRCGTSNVFIESQATANLYIYTPYRPNSAALNNLYGTGDSCSSYGNRNFWRMFNDWFGSTQSSSVSRIISCDNELFLYEKTERRKRSFTETGLDTWGLPGSRTIINEDFACSYPTYDLTAERLARSRDTGKLYLIDMSNAYHIATQDIASAWGLGDINQTVPQFEGKSFHENLHVQGTLPRVVTSSNKSRTDSYIIDGRKRYTVAGTPEGDYKAQDLLRGYNEVPFGEISVELLQTLPAETDVDYSFKVGTSRYLVDHGIVRKIQANNLNDWSTIPHGPNLSSSAPSIFKSVETIPDSFTRDGFYYRINANGLLEKTKSNKILDNWTEGNKAPVITRLLTGKIVGDASNIQSVDSIEGNIRLINCGGSPYLIERNIRKKRAVSETAIVHWALTDYYFYENDRGCAYSTYSLELNQTIRSRNTGKLYKVISGEAHYIKNQSDADEQDIEDINDSFPQFDPASIIDNLEIVR